MVFAVFLVCFTALFAWVLWRVAGKPQDQVTGSAQSPPSRGETGLLTVITGTGGPALGMPESLVDDQGLHPGEAAWRQPPPGSVEAD